MQRVVKGWKPPAALMLPQGEFRANGAGRRYLSVSELPFRREAFSAFGIDEIYDEPAFQNFIGEHFEDGAHTHAHRDTAPEGFMHVRANWMLAKPQRGGDPVLGGSVVPVQEGDLWVCFASEETHASTPITGGPRRICSFGALVPRPLGFDLGKVVQ